MHYHQDFLILLFQLSSLKQLDAGADEDTSHPARLLKFLSIGITLILRFMVDIR